MVGKAKKSSVAVTGKADVILVDDHPVVRQGLAGLVNQAEGLEVVGEASTASQALELANEKRPHLVVVDLGLGEGSGIELIKQLRAMHSGCHVLVVSMHDDELFAERAIRAGAAGYVNKQNASEDIVTAIRTVLRGEIYLNPAIAGTVLRRAVTDEDDPQATAVERLSDRELEVFMLMGKGRTTRQIADQLQLSRKTIDTHREHIKTKLQIDNTNDLVRQATVWLMGQAAEEGEGAADEE